MMPSSTRRRLIPFPIVTAHDGQPQAWEAQAQRDPKLGAMPQVAAPCAPRDAPADTPVRKRQQIPGEGLRILDNESGTTMRCRDLVGGLAVPTEIYHRICIHSKPVKGSGRLGGTAHIRTHARTLGTAIVPTPDACTRPGRASDPILIRVCVFGLLISTGTPYVRPV